MIIKYYDNHDDDYDDDDDDDDYDYHHHHQPDYELVWRESCWSQLTGVMRTARHMRI